MLCFYSCPYEYFTLAQMNTKDLKNVAPIYNTLVAKEIAKEVYIREGLKPPNGTQISETWDALKSIRLNDLTNLGPREFAKIGIRALEVFGFFAIGEVIGRRSLVGYNTD